MDPTPVVSPLTDVGGTLQNRVTARTADDDGLNFMPRIRQTFNIDGGIFAIVGLSLTGFAGFDIDADYRRMDLATRVQPASRAPQTAIS